MALADFLAAAPVRRVVAVNEAGEYAGAVRKLDWLNGAVVAISGTSAKTGAIAATEVALTTSQGCWIKFGVAASVTAVTGGAGCMYIDPGMCPVYLQFTSGQAVAAIHNSGTGYLSVIPVL
jgi:hypothetical protein